MMLKNIKNSTFFLLYAGMLGVLLASVVFAIYVGAVDITPTWVFQILANHLTGQEIFKPLWPGYADGIVWGMRLPKVLVAAFMGGGLSLVGIMIQAMTKNSMADPYLLGISSGATAAILIGSLPLIGTVDVRTGAFLGAMVSAGLVFLLAGASGRVSSTKLILSGTAVSALFSVMSNLMIFLQSNEKKLSAVLFWMTGSFAGVAWADVLPAFVSLLVCAAVMLSSLVTGIMVSGSGTIGFVGLVIPHISRSIVGTAHRRMVPFALLLGGILMIWADALARVVVAPSELPIGVVTAFIGAPFFLLLLHGSKYSFQ